MIEKSWNSLIYIVRLYDRIISDHGGATCPQSLHLRISASPRQRSMTGLSCVPRSVT
jgi:hypothetical protein